MGLVDGEPPRPRVAAVREQAVHQKAFGRNEQEPQFAVAPLNGTADPDMVLPHPKAHERAFVLAPWNDVEPDAELLDHGPVAELLAKAGSDGITRRDDLVLTLQ